MHATIPKGNMGYDQYTVPDDCSCRTYFCCFPLALANTVSWPFVPILSNFFQEWRTQNHPQCLSRLSRALFPTTFLEIAVYLLEVRRSIKVHHKSAKSYSRNITVFILEEKCNEEASLVKNVLSPFIYWTVFSFITFLK